MLQEGHFAKHSAQQFDYIVWISGSSWSAHYGAQRSEFDYVAAVARFVAATTVALA